LDDWTTAGPALAMRLADNLVVLAPETASHRAGEICLAHVLFADAQLGGSTGELGVRPLAAIGLYSSLWMSWTVWWRGLAAISIRERVMTAAVSQRLSRVVICDAVYSTAMLITLSCTSPAALRRNGRVVGTWKLVIHSHVLVGLISEWPSAAGARLDADAPNCP